MFKFITSLVGDSTSSQRKALALLELRGKEDFPVRSSLHAARKKVGWGFFRRLLRQCAESVESAYGDRYLYKGHKVYAIDGSKINLPNKLKRSKYKGTHKGCHYPQGLLVSLYRLKLNIPVDFEFRRRVGETKAVPHLLRSVKAGSVVVYDRLYFSQNVLREHQQKKIHGVFRLKSKCTLKEVTDFIASGKKEYVCLVQRKDLKIRLRFIRYRIRGNNYYIATTLLDQGKYPARSIMDLYHSRWGIEESFKFIKQEIQVQRFNSHSAIGIKQELAIAMILDVLASILKIRLGRTKRTSKGVTNKLIVTQIQDFWTTRGNVRNQAVENLVAIPSHHIHQSLPGRSFQRRSRKVINRWQKSIAQEWDRKRRLSTKGKYP